jgi:hypothetical protein
MKFGSGRVDFFWKNQFVIWICFVILLSYSFAFGVQRDYKKLLSPTLLYFNTK